MREIYKGNLRESRVEGFDAMTAVASGKNQENPLPLDCLKEVTDYGFDVEDTVLRHTPWNLSMNFGHFLRYELSKQSGDQIDPKAYLAVAPTAEALRTTPHGEKSALWQPYREVWNTFQNDTWDYLRENVGDEDKLRRAVYNFVYVTHGDEARGSVAAEVLGLESTAELWKAYGQFWKEIASDPIEANNHAPSITLPGTIDLLNLLSEKGKRIHFITNAEGKRIDALLQQLYSNGFQGNYNLVSARDLGMPKPQPGAFHKIYDQYEIQPQDSLHGKYPFVYFGNAITDIQAGDAASSALVGMIDAYGTDYMNQDVPAHYRMRNFKPLHAYLQTH